VKEITNPDLAALLAAAAAPEPDPDERGLEAVLVAYRAAPYTAPHRAPAAARPTRGRSMPGGFVLKFAAAVVLLAGGGVLAASAGALPDSIQRIAHDYLGGVGVPAPPAASTSPSAKASASPGRSHGPSSTFSAGPDASSSAAVSLSPSSSSSPSASATPTTSASPNDLVTLCRIVVRTGKSWHSKVDAAQRTTLVNAAGSDPKVLPYCTGLLNGSPSNGTNSNAPTPTDPPSPSPSSKHNDGNDTQSSVTNNGQD
jgi:hypothetical protein